MGGRADPAIGGRSGRADPAISGRSGRPNPADGRTQPTGGTSGRAEPADGRRLLFCVVKILDFITILTNLGFVNPNMNSEFESFFGGEEYEV